MKKVILLFVFLTAITLNAENIKLKNGSFIKNVKIIKETSEYLILMRQNKKTFKLNKNIILYIMPEKFNPDKPTEIKEDYVPADFPDNQFSPEYKQRLYLLPVTLLGAVYAYDLIQQIKALDSLNDLPAFNMNNELSERYIMLTLTVAAVILNTYFAFEKIRINPKENGIGLSYRF